MEGNIVWHLAAKVDQIPNDYGFRAVIGELSIAIFRIEGEYFATEDQCTHRQGSLAEGYLDGDEVECPLHQGRFHIPTGKALCRPLTVDLKTFPTKVEGDGVFVDLTGVKLA